MAIVTRAEVKVHCGIAEADTTFDAFIDQVIPPVEAAFKKLVDRDIALQSYTEYLDGNGKQVILLRECPVTSVSEVRVDPNGLYGQSPDAFPASTILTAGVDYALVKDGRNGLAETGKLMRLNSVWPGGTRWTPGLLSPQRVPGRGNIKVTFAAGFDPIPPEIKLALWQVVAELMAMRKNGVLKSSESFDGASLSWIQQQAQQMLLLPGSRAQVVARYRRITPRFSTWG